MQEMNGNTLHFYYMQGVWEVTRGNYLCSDSEAVVLAACQAQVVLGSAPLDGNYLQKNARSFFASRNWVTLSTNINAVVTALGDERRKLGGITGTDAELRYVQTLRQNKLYGCTFFPVVEMVSRERKEDIILCVAESGISFINALTRQHTRKSFKLSEVEVDFKEQGLFSTLSFSVGQFLQKKTYIFETKQCRQIKELISSYLETD